MNVLQFCRIFFANAAKSKGLTTPWSPLARAFFVLEFVLHGWVEALKNSATTLAFGQEQSWARKSFKPACKNTQV
jgi:hypothetical protein